MLKKIIVKNYRSCLKTTFECHPQLSVLIGPNSSGKTNILHAILLLNKMCRQEEYHRSRVDPMMVTSRIQASFCASLANARLDASVDSYADDSNNDVLLGAKQRWFLKRPDGKDTSLEMPLWGVTRFPIGLMGSKIQLYARERGILLARYAREYAMFAGMPQKPSDAWVLETLVSVGQFCSGIRYYSASQFTNPGGCPVSFEIEKEGTRSRFLRLRGHAKMLYHMYMAGKDGQSDKYEQFMSIVGRKGLGLVDDVAFKEFTTSSTDYEVRVGGKPEKRRRYKLLIIPRFRIGRHWLSPNQLSEGTFKTLALLFYIITEESAALLIEEPEVCIHHGLLASILELIKTYADRKQMIVSTHSDYVLDHVSPENVFRVRRDKLEGTTVKHIRKSMTGKEYSALRRYLEADGNLGEYWREGGLGD